MFTPTPLFERTTNRPDHALNCPTGLITTIIRSAYDENKKNFKHARTTGGSCTSLPSHSSLCCGSPQRVRRRHGPCRDPLRVFWCIRNDDRDVHVFVFHTVRLVRDGSASFQTSRLCSLRHQPSWFHHKTEREHNLVAATHRARSTHPLT